MEVTLKPEQEVFISHAVSEGRFTSADDALQQAVALLLEREAARSDETPSMSLGEFLMRSPLYKSGLVIERAQDGPSTDLF